LVVVVVVMICEGDGGVVVVVICDGDSGVVVVICDGDGDL
jgi:hypothetical protein